MSGISLVIGVAVGIASVSPELQLVLLHASTVIALRQLLSKLSSIECSLLCLPIHVLLAASKCLKVQ
jgi:hypothetical protein